jgi:hypothetical protein
MATHHAAAGIEYHRVAGFAHEIFRCTPWRANLSIPACADRWTRAQTARGDLADELRLCMGCRIGAAHAGERFVERSPNYLSNRCARCRHGSGRRLIGGKLCLSCYNRELEWLKGKNGKGTIPHKAASMLALRTIGVLLDAGEDTERRVRFTDIAVDTDELEFTVTRLHMGRIEFCEPSAAAPEWRPEGLRPAPHLDRLPATAFPAPPRPIRIIEPPLKRAALSSSCFSPGLRGMTRRTPAWMIGSRGSPDGNPDRRKGQAVHLA